MVAQWEMDLYWQDEFNKIFLKFYSQWVNIKDMTQKQKFLEDWRNGLVVKNTNCSSKRTWVQFPVLRWQFTTVCNSIPRESDTLL